MRLHVLPLLHRSLQDSHPSTCPSSSALRQTTRWWIRSMAIFTVLNELVFINLKQKIWQAIASLHFLMVTQPTASKQHISFSASCKWFSWKPRAKLNRWENNVENIHYLSLSRNSFQSCQFGPITIQNLSRAFLPIHIFRRHKDFFFFFKESKLHLLRLVELHAIIIFK